MNKKEIKKRINEIKERTQDIDDQLKYLENDDNRYNYYDDFIDAVTPKINIVGREFNPSYILRKMDELFYEIGESDYITNKINDLEYEKEELEKELEELKGGNK